MRLGLYLMCVTLLVGCAQAPVSRPPVVDASWRANEDDRVVSSMRVIPKVLSDGKTQNVESNKVTPD